MAKDRRTRAELQKAEEKIIALYHKEWSARRELDRKLEAVTKEHEREVKNLERRIKTMDDTHTAMVLQYEGGETAYQEALRLIIETLTKARK